MRTLTPSAALLPDFLRFDPSKLQFMEVSEVPLAPQAASVGLDIRVVGNDSGEKVRCGGTWPEPVGLLACWLLSSCWLGCSRRLASWLAGCWLLAGRLGRCSRRCYLQFPPRHLTGAACWLCTPCRSPS